MQKSAPRLAHFRQLARQESFPLRTVLFVVLLCTNLAISSESAVKSKPAESMTDISSIESLPIDSQVEVEYLAKNLGDRVGHGDANRVAAPNNVPDRIRPRVGYLECVGTGAAACGSCNAQNCLLGGRGERVYLKRQHSGRLRGIIIRRHKGGTVIRANDESKGGGAIHHADEAWRNTKKACV